MKAQVNGLHNILVITAPLPNLLPKAPERALTAPRDSGRRTAAKPDERALSGRTVRLMAATGNGPLVMKIVGGSLMGLAGLGMLAAQLGGGSDPHKVSDSLSREAAFLQLTSTDPVMSQIDGQTLYDAGKHVCSVLSSNGGSQTLTVAQLHADNPALDEESLAPLVSDAAVTLC